MSLMDERSTAESWTDENSRAQLSNKIGAQQIDADMWAFYHRLTGGQLLMHHNNKSVFSWHSYVLLTISIIFGYTASVRTPRPDAI